VDDAGDIGGFTVSNDDDGNAIGSYQVTRDDGGNLIGSSSIAVPQATNNGGNYGDPFKILESVTTSIAGAAKTYLQFKQSAANFKTAQSNIDLSRDQSLAANDIARLNNATALQLETLKTSGAVDVAKFNAQTQSLLAQKALSSAAMPTLSSLFYPAAVNPATGQAAINPLFIIAAAGTFALAWHSMKHGHAL
jgi:hypothetical protein